MTAGFAGAVSADSESIDAKFIYQSTGDLKITFTDTSSSTNTTINNWDWDFGDSSSHGSKNAETHTYTSAGDYTIKLTVTNTSSGTNNNISKKITVDKIEISSIDVSGITEPSVGNEPITSAPTVSGTGVDANSVSKITWKTNSGTSVGNNNFTYDTIYKAVFTVNASKNYKFVGTTHININQGAGLMSIKSDGSGEVTITYTKTAVDPVVTE
ncbi:MAG: PKD domain-containing protein, partial [Methanocorpusculum sp.]|nr:PKD domain-containing protein [Methanocorpusculum sp.]